MVAGHIDADPPLAIAGIRIGCTGAGIKHKDRDDLVVVEIATGATCAAAFTRNAFCAAPVTLARRHLEQASPRYLLINSGNANAGTGAAGLADALTTCQLVAGAAGCEAESVLPFSTGVIGASLPVALFESPVPVALAACVEDGWVRASRAIMTTDTVPKAVSRQRRIGGGTVTVTGIAKGSGMIHPDMATMLAYVATDAAVDAAVLQDCLTKAVNRSFNRVTVDGDTSTNDACVLIATGRSAAPRIADPDSPEAVEFQAVIDEVFAYLAEAVVRDGEGATKFMRIEVAGGLDERECLDVGFTVAHSPLVKTAFFASDANWGRILAAVGRAGLRDFDIDRVTIDLNRVRIVEHGGRAASYTEEAGQAAMQPSDITVHIELGRGTASAAVLTCDFSHDYVRINAEYRT